MIFAPIFLPIGLYKKILVLNHDLLLEKYNKLIVIDVNMATMALKEFKWILFPVITA